MNNISSTFRAQRAVLSGLAALALALSAQTAFAACTTAASVMTCTVSSTADTVDATGLPANAVSLRDAIIQVNSVAPAPAGQTHIINLPASFIGTSFKVKLFKFLPPIWNDVTLNGNGNTIEGNNFALTGTGFDTRLFIVGSNGDVSGQPYFAAGARVKFTLNDLTLKNGVARGGMGGGGGMGAGGAIFITGNGDLTARNVLFDGNGAMGGNGGSASVTRGGGGMGGNAGSSGGGGWGGDGFAGGGGLTGAGGGGAGRSAGGGGLANSIIGLTLSLRGVAIASAGTGTTTNGFGTSSGGAYGGGGGGSSSGSPNGASGNASGAGGDTSALNARNGGGGGGAGGAAAAVNGNNGIGGAGGFGGGGGSAVTGGGVGGFGGGGGSNQAGGFGGGAGRESTAQSFGGGGAAAISGTDGGAGGFGGGGAGADAATGGQSAFAGGSGGSSTIALDRGGHAGGAGLGGAVFVHTGGTFTLAGGSRLTQNYVAGGGASAGVGSTAPGTDGKACGAGIFVHGAQSITINPSSGETVALDDQVADNDCAGTVSPSGAGGVTKNGAGTLEIRGTHSFTRGLFATEGVVRFSGNSAAHSVVNGRAPGARFESDGSAVFASGISVTGNSVFSPGISLPGQLHRPARQVVSRLALTGFGSSSGRLEINLGGINPGSEFSQVAITGTNPLDFTSNFGPPALVVKLKPGYTPSVGDSFPIIDHGGVTVLGSFNGLPENATFTVANVTFRINYSSVGAVRLTVTAAPSATATISLQAANSSVAVGQTVLLTATVAGGSGAPTGDVAFVDSGTGAIISGCEARAVAGGAATCNASFATAAGRTLVATYLGNATYRAATSSPLVQTVTKGASAISLSSASNPAAAAANVLFTATLTPAAVNRTGTVTFTSNGSNIVSCVAKPVVSDSAYCVTSFAATGGYSIVASYSGDVNYDASSSSALAQVVSDLPSAPQAVVSTAAAPSQIGQVSVAFAAPVSNGGSAIASYTATCSRLAPAAPLPMSASGPASPIVVTPLELGAAVNCTVTATNGVGTGPASAASNTATPVVPLNVDASTATAYDAATDGVMIMRALFGLTGTAISNGVRGATATRDAAQIAGYLAALRPELDIDGNGQIDALTDGLLIVRYMLNLRGTALTAGAAGPSPGRTLAEIEAYLATLMP